MLKQIEWSNKHIYKKKKNLGKMKWVFQFQKNRVSQYAFRRNLKKKRETNKEREKKNKQ